MPPKPSSPGPVTTSRKPRKREQDVIPATPGRAGSAGGVVLETATKTTGEKDEKMSGTATAKTVPPSSSTAKDADVVGPNRQRRRPRKLNREPASQKPGEPSATATASEAVPSAAALELEALKSRVRGLEAKVEELYQNGADVRSGRSPRRRGKKKNSSQQVPTTSTVAAETGYAGEEEEADEELVRLEGELEVARRDLESYAPRPRKKRSTSNDSDEVEEIDREEPGTESIPDTKDRQVTLTGSYRIPLPSNVSMKDVKSIQSGVSAAQNVAKSFLEQRRAAQAVQNQTQSKSQTSTSKPRPKAKSSSSSKEVSTAVATDDNGKQSWSEWFGGYSMAISKAVQNIEAEAAVEAQKAQKAQKKKPAQPGRTTSTPSTKTSKPAASSTKTSAGTTTKSTQRPPLKQRTGNLSSDQVQELMG